MRLPLIVFSTRQFSQPPSRHDERFFNVLKSYQTAKQWSDTERGQAQSLRSRIQHGQGKDIHETQIQELCRSCHIMCDVFHLQFFCGVRFAESFSLR